MIIQNSIPIQMQIEFPNPPIQNHHIPGWIIQEGLVHSPFTHIYLILIVTIF